MRVLAALVALILLGTFAPFALYRDPPLPARPLLVAEPVALDDDRPGRTRLGRLDFLGGWALSSNDPRFGGISAIHVADGRVTAMSDAGTLIRFALPAPGGGRSRLDIGALPDGPGSAEVKFDRDVEAMALHAEPGGEAAAWLSFERLNAVWRYALPDWKASASARPAAMRDWSANGGAEGMVRLPGGRFLIFSEARGEAGTSPVLLFDGDPSDPATPAVELRFAPPEGYRVTDAAVMDGGLLVLVRRISLFEGMSARLLWIEKPDLRAGARLEGEAIAAFDAPVITDNLEGLSVAREGGETILWIASDDNFNALQETLLLKFRLRAPRPGAAAR